MICVCVYVCVYHSERVYSFHAILKARWKTTGLFYQGIKEERLLIFLDSVSK